MELNLDEDLVEKYSNGRKNVPQEDVEDLMRIFKSYLQKRMNSDECYAIDIKYIGTLYKEFDEEKFKEILLPKTRKERLLEKQFINSLYKPVPTKIYNYDEIDLAKENTNNHPIKK